MHIFPDLYYGLLYVFNGLNCLYSTAQMHLHSSKTSNRTQSLEYIGYFRKSAPIEHRLMHSSSPIQFSPALF